MIEYAEQKGRARPAVVSPNSSLAEQLESPQPDSISITGDTNRRSPKAQVPANSRFQISSDRFAKEGSSSWLSDSAVAPMIALLVLSVVF